MAHAGCYVGNFQDGLSRPFRTLLQMRLRSGSGSSGDEKLLGSRCIWRIQLTRFRDILDVGGEQVKDDAKSFGPSKWRKNNFYYPNWRRA